ncbi:MAG: class I SAM-dependent methyltransferase [Micavibrio sp.]|nr:MAG: class I SAM-dependent methyltransferase [Micavibrio sp.]
MLKKFVTDNFFRLMEKIEYGGLEVVTPDGRKYVFQGKKPGPVGHLELRSWNVISNMSARGDIGLAEDYRDGRWETRNLADFLNFGLQNYPVLKNYIQGSGVFRTVATLSYLTRLNTLSGSRRNIHAHYDLGNEFYRLWLDSSMTYSSALFKGKGEDIRAAQQNKYDRILDAIGDRPQEILEIGCGWGGFAERAVMRRNHRVTGLTLSQEQLSYARQRMPDGQASFLLQDYRHAGGKYDSIVSIEMFEAVGEKYWPVYFQRIAELLKPGGRAVIQTITIREDAFEDYRKSGDMIRSFIFPGGMLPSKSRFAQEAARAGLKVQNPHCFGQDYARTLEIWLQNFDAARKEVKALGFDDHFIRLWRFYLAGCIAGFRTARTDVMQVELCHV